MVTYKIITFSLSHIIKLKEAMIMPCSDAAAYVFFFIKIVIKAFLF